MRPLIKCLLLTISLLPARLALAADPPSYTRTEDVIYGRKYGTALTLDVFTPKAKSNGAGVIFCVSGGWFSAHESINPAFYAPLLDHGYTVFAVVHGSQPRYTIPEVIEDMHRSVRFIRHNADRFHIDANRLGITGGSAGGHLSLMIGTAGAPGPADAKDLIDRESSRVQAVACFFPPTDFLNYNESGRNFLQALEAELADFKAPFDFRELDPKTHRLLIIRDRERRLEIARQISPITHVTPDDPPTMIIHGDADKLVPIQQSRVMEERLREAKVPVKLIVKPGAGHGWPDWQKDIEIMAQWFDQYLKNVPAIAPSNPNQ